MLGLHVMNEEKRVWVPGMAKRKGEREGGRERQEKVSSIQETGGRPRWEKEGYTGSQFVTSVAITKARVQIHKFP